MGNIEKCNLFEKVSGALSEERFETILAAPNVKIERILSLGHASPLDGWYDQSENEWVMVLQGHGRLEFDDGAVVDLEPGDCIEIPAHTRHRVAWTDPKQMTIWLAVFFS